MVNVKKVLFGKLQCFSHHKLKNLIVYLDLNQKQSSGKTSSILIEPISNKWRSFGWNTVVVDGHSHKNLFMLLKR